MKKIITLILIVAAVLSASAQPANETLKKAYEYGISDRYAYFGTSWGVIGTTRPTWGPVETVGFGSRILGNELLTGTQNVVLGENAGNGITTGSRNMVFGRLIMNGTVSGSNNIGIGTNVLTGTTISNTHNIGIGTEIFQGATFSGSGDNVAIGYRTSASLTTGNRNVTIGRDAGRYATTMSSSVIIGYQAGVNNNASRAIIIGQGAVLNNINEGGIAIGQNVMGNAPSGSGGSNREFCFVGRYSGYSVNGATATVRENSSYGPYTLINTYNGSHNFAAGNSAGTAIINDTDNTAIGARSFRHTVDDTITYVTASATASVFTLNAPHGLAANTPVFVRFSGTSPGMHDGIDTGTKYAAFLASGTHGLVVLSPLTAVDGQPYTMVRQILVSNATVVGARAYPDKSNQVTLGNDNVTELRSRNYRFRVNQTLGSGQNGHVFKYNHSIGQIEAQADLAVALQDSLNTLKARVDSLEAKPKMLAGVATGTTDLDGEFTITFPSSMPSTSYAVSLLSADGYMTFSVKTKATGSVTIIAYQGGVAAASTAYEVDWIIRGY
jgi:hypothetical protein